MSICCLVIRIISRHPHAIYLSFQEFCKAFGMTSLILTFDRIHRDMSKWQKRSFNAISLRFQSISSFLQQTNRRSVECRGVQAYALMFCYFDVRMKSFSLKTWRKIGALNDFLAKMEFIKICLTLLTLQRQSIFPALKYLAVKSKLHQFTQNVLASLLLALELASNKKIVKCYCNSLVLLKKQLRMTITLARAEDYRTILLS